MSRFANIRTLMKLRSLKSRHEQRDPHYAPVVEALEDRLLLTTYVVDSLDDSALATPDGSLTLREAIMAANENLPFGDAAAGSATGDKIVFAASLQNGDITLTAGELSVTDDLFIDGDGSNITINADNASRIFNVNANAPVTFRGLTLENGLSTTGGGAIHSANGLTTLSNMHFRNNKSAGQGGAVFNSGDLIVASSSFARNQANGVNGNGGAILNNGDSVNISNTRFQVNDAATAGGGLYSSRGNIRIKGSVFKTNTAQTSGGGLEIAGGNLHLSNVNLSSNSASDALGVTGNGGGLSITGSNSDVVINSSTLRGNQAAANGGGIYNDSTLLKVNASLLASNNAAGDLATNGGGAIYNQAGKLRLKDSVVKSNAADGTQGSGGGLFVNDGFAIVVRTNLRSNVANRAGGGLEIVGGKTRIIDSFFGGATAALGNKAGLGAAANPGNGGALHVSGSNVKTILKGGSVLNNTAASEGGGLWNQAGSKMFVVGTVLQDNSARGNAADNGGGALFNNGGTLRIKDADIVSNVASGASGSGGGILSTDGNLVVKNSRIITNSAKRAGGGVEVIDGRAFLKNVSLGGAANTDGNIAGPSGTGNPGNGGGLHVSGTSGTRVVINGGEIRHNVASSEGGGLWNQQGSQIVLKGGVPLSNNLAFGNDADNGGGAIFNNGGKLLINDAAIVANYALGTNASGGGIFTSDGRVVVRDSLIDSNTASRAGGGVEVVNGQVRLQNVNLNANTAGTSDSATPGNGGGLHVSGNNATVNFRGGFVQNNDAANAGGGLWNQSGSRMVLNDTTVSANEAFNASNNSGGGGIFNNGGKLVVNSANVSGNNSEGAGGGIFNAANGSTVVRDSIVNGNVADNFGGGMFNRAKLNVADSDVIGNVAGLNGGGIFTTATGDTRVSGSTIVGNSPNQNA
jgi:hypothetical protein